MTPLHIDKQTLPGPSPPQFSRGEYAILLAVMLFAFCSRFFALETPSMWWDEILVPMTARYPLEYIFDWAKNLEVNSPYYIILIKLILLLGKSDFCLRLLSATAGVCAILAIAHVGRILINKDVGLFSAIILSSWPLHILLSRQLRPYSLFSLFLILSIWRLFVFVYQQDNKLRNAAILGAVYTCLFSLHYMAAPVILSHGIFVIIVFTTLKKTSYQKIFHFCVASLASFAVVAPFFIGTFLQRKDMTGASHSHLETLARVLSTIYHISYSYVTCLSLDYTLPDSLHSLAGATLFLCIVAFACLRAYRSDRVIGIFLASSIFVPLALFIITRQQIWRPRHLSFLIPPFSLAIALLLSKLPFHFRNMYCKYGIYCLIIISFYLPLLVFYPNQLYYEESYPDVYKSQARQIAGFVPIGQPVIVASPGDGNAITWYLDQFMTNNPLSYQTIKFGSHTIIHLVTPGENFGTANAYQREFLDSMGPVSSKNTLSKATIFNYDLDCEPLTTIEPNKVATLSAKPWLFYRKVSEIKNVTTDWNNDPFVHPTLSEAACSFSKDYKASPELSSALIEGELKFFSFGLDNTIACTAIVDNKHTLRLANATGKCGTIVKRFKIIRQNNFSSISFNVEMSCGTRTPLYPGSNLGTIGFNELILTATPLKHVRWGSLSLMETFEGLDPIESSPEGEFRWGHGPNTKCSFNANNDEEITLKYSFTNVLPHQDIDIIFNGNIVKTYSNIPAQRWLKEDIAGSLSLTAIHGENNLVFRYNKYNGLDPTSTFASADSRPLAVAFSEFIIEKQDHALVNEVLN